MIVAFTGSRYITDADRARIAVLIDELPKETIIVTGGCVGVDAFVAGYAHAHGYIVHTVLPADHSRVDPHWRERCHSFEQMAPDTTYQDRNVRLVAIGTEVIGVPLHPEGHKRSQRSGTWQTVRLARKAGKLRQVETLREEQAA